MHRTIPQALCAAASLAIAASAAAATTQIAYTYHDNSTNAAWIVDWQAGHRAHVVSYAGAADGTFADIPGGQRVIGFDTPYSYTYGSIDCNGQPFSQRVDVTQLSFRQTGGTAMKGTANLIELGTTTDIGGCTPGQVVPFGSLGDPGVASDALAMTLRPSTSDLVPGTSIAGFMEGTVGSFLDLGQTAEDVVTVNAGSITFATTGHVVPVGRSNGWLVLSLPGGGQRAYTRLSANATTGEEVWIDAPWVAGAPQATWRTMMVKPLAGAGFGGTTKAAKRWESGLFFGTNNPFYCDLYKDGTGTRRALDLAAGTESDTPITWHLDGANLVQDKTTGTARERTWSPLANIGTLHWVMEKEIFTVGGNYNIAPRVNFYIDEGVAPPPAKLTTPTLPN